MGEVWVQTIFYPFSYMARYGRGTVLEDIISCPTYDCEGFQKVPYIDEVDVYNEEEKGARIGV
jgi:alpha-N-arabinofuranosidase